MKGLYFLVDFMVIIVPLACSFHPAIRFDKLFKAFMLSNFLVAIPFIVWDILFTKMGIWSFNARYICGLYFFNLPIEEVFFFVCIPFACVFTFFCLEKFDVQLPLKARFFSATPIVCIALAILAVVHPNQRYTATSFILAAIAGLTIAFIHEKWINTFLTSYLIILLPFIVVNGLLTGTSLAAPIVSYNPSAIIGWHFFSIPVEDFFYSFVMQYFNVALFHLARTRIMRYSRAGSEGAVQ